MSQKRPLGSGRHRSHRRRRRGTVGRPAWCAAGRGSRSGRARRRSPRAPCTTPRSVITRQGHSSMSTTCVSSKSRRPRRRISRPAPEGRRAGAGPPGSRSAGRGRPGTVTAPRRSWSRPGRAWRSPPPLRQSVDVWPPSASRYPARRRKSQAFCSSSARGPMRSIASRCPAAASRGAVEAEREISVRQERRAPRSACSGALSVSPCSMRRASTTRYRRPSSRQQQRGGDSGDPPPTITTSTSDVAASAG